MQVFLQTDDGHRQRLLDGFVDALGEKGYAATTIADIVGRAKVSKRTFYEHFDDKEACLIATYRAGTENMLAAMRIAFVANEGKGWAAQLDAAVDAYVTALEATPPLTRACLVEMAAAGPRARKIRREVREQYAALLRECVEQARGRYPDVAPISEPMATAIVGGIDELLLAQVEGAPRERLTDVRRTASELLRAVLAPPAKRD